MKFQFLDRNSFGSDADGRLYPLSSMVVSIPRSEFFRFGPVALAATGGGDEVSIPRSEFFRFGPWCWRAFDNCFHRFQFLDRNSFGSDLVGGQVGAMRSEFQFLDRNSFGSDGAAGAV